MFRHSLIHTVGISKRLLAANIMSAEGCLNPKRAMSDKKRERLIWVDLEMSGLDVNKEHILEMACLVTDQDLNIIAESEDLVIHQPPTVLDNMGEWCKEHHGKSGLTEAVRRSQISLMEAEDRMLRFVKEHTLPGSAPLAGNSVHADRTFLVKYMPRFTHHLHYRIVDVSTVKELSRRWNRNFLVRRRKNCRTERWMI